jgi:hypothetical protein
VPDEHEVFAAESKSQVILTMSHFARRCTIDGTPLEVPRSRCTTARGVVAKRSTSRLYPPPPAPRGAEGGKPPLLPHHFNRQRPDRGAAATRRRCPRQAATWLPQQHWPRKYDLLTSRVGDAQEIRKDPRSYLRKPPTVSAPHRPSQTIRFWGEMSAQLLTGSSVRKATANAVRSSPA